MNILSVKEKNAIAASADILLSGGLIVVPTDTVYGIIGDATNERAILNLFLLKKRSKKKPFPIFVKDIAMARQYASISDVKARSLKTLWPGRMTALFYHKEKLPSSLTAGGDFLGIRIPDSLFLRELLLRINVPLVQTSANLSGSAPAQCLEDIKRYFQHSKTAPDCVIDGGILPTTASAVVDFTRDMPLIVRTGLMPKQELNGMLRQLYK
ncbi:MAG: threonylcarbamoyl-AMP synthase [Candidatus Colwellbacteria bacterium]|nr:threonylcarbamoyl-AMP synthase [Candidatus Colwellbacteria bacterium]